LLESHVTTKGTQNTKGTKEELKAARTKAERTKAETAKAETAKTERSLRQKPFQFTRATQRLKELNSP
jgi:hypothetical protein